MQLTLQDSTITVFPYIRGVAEYARELRTWFLGHQQSDFFVAVDLPHGLEPEVLKAVKRLPAISLIVDPLKRAIPIIPTCASVEAVRSFLEAGLNYAFIDTSLPIIGDSGDWNRLLTLCHEIGEKEAFEHAEEHGIDLNNLLELGPPYPPENVTLFDSLPTGLQSQRKDACSFPSGYREARDRHMGAQLANIAGRFQNILFICENSHVDTVLAYARSPDTPAEDIITVPTVTCKVKEKDIYKISREIPYFLYNYELYRDNQWSREQWTLNLLAHEKTDPGEDVRSVYQYARNLGLADGEAYPGLYNLLLSAKACAGDHYAIQVLHQALSYPPADTDSNCEITVFRDYDLQPVAGQRVLALTGDDPASGWWKKSQKKRQKKQSKGVYNFVRTPGSLDAENRFMKYLLGRYVDPAAVDEFQSEPFTAGLKDGLDIRETLRQHGSGRIFVREQELRNTAAYVVNFGGKPDWRVFFDTKHQIVGAAAWESDHRHAWICFAGFSEVDVPMESLIDQVDLDNPLRSCLEIALSHARHVFLFSDSFDDEVYFGEQMRRVKVIDLQTIPMIMREEMRWFETIA